MLTEEQKKRRKRWAIERKNTWRTNATIRCLAHPHASEHAMPYVSLAFKKHRCPLDDLLLSKLAQIPGARRYTSRGGYECVAFQLTASEIAGLGLQRIPDDLKV